MEDFGGKDGTCTRSYKPPAWSVGPPNGPGPFDRFASSRVSFHGVVMANTLVVNLVGFKKNAGKWNIGVLYILSHIGNCTT